MGVEIRVLVHPAFTGRLIAWAMLAIGAMALWDSPVIAGGQDDQQSQTVLQGQFELARLVDLVSERLGPNIENDGKELSGQVTLRLGAGVSDDELWSRTNRLLASRDLTTIRMPGEDMLCVVRIGQAATFARIEPVNEVRSPLAPPAGYITTIVPVDHQPLDKTSVKCDQLNCDVCT